MSSEAASARTISFWAENLRVTEAGNARSLNFWDVPLSLREQQRMAFPGVGDGAPQLPAIKLLFDKVQPGTLKSGISIGCGSGHKELKLIKAGAVEHFTLVELVPELLESARKRFEAEGLASNAWCYEGSFEQLIDHRFDLIYFDNSLHHMYDIKNLIPKVLTMLKPGGFFVMDDFVGPTYNQFTEEVYNYADHVRRLLPTDFWQAGDIVPELARLPVEAYLNSDPSEACDSGAILPAIAKHMPGVEIIPTGGLIYYLACREVFHKLTAGSDRDEAIIRLLYELDRALVKANPDLTCYALAIWQKPEVTKQDSTAVEEADWKKSIRWPDWGLPI